ncbi:hypothetical protein ACE7GA_07370 [Roseomonas sp. CCTCC AB2023176]|uniref:hypothetical protein n=1 Tax=Roseomonas sp. CCTCC AB2023176 TaxID=3342640 RepID=UPI0035E17ACF
MSIKTEPTYTEYEVSRILRDSEGQSIRPTDRGEGHAEANHELVAQGKNRASITFDGLEMRIIGDEGLPASSAFDGCQVAAITYALNTRAGQTALGYLCWDRCEWVFARIGIAAGNFRMVGYNAQVTRPAPSGARFVVGPSRTGPDGSWRPAIVLPGLLDQTPGIAGGIGMKLMKTVGKALHIRTAFPLANAPVPPRARIRWVGAGEQDQDLPV